MSLSARGGSPAALSPGRPATHPALQSAIEVTSDSSRIEWHISQLLTGHTASLEVVLSEQRKLASYEADQRVERLEQQLGRLGDHLTKRLDGLHGLAAGARRKQSKQSSDWREAAEAVEEAQLAEESQPEVPKGPRFWPGLPAPQQATFTAKDVIHRIQETEKKMDMMQDRLLKSMEASSRWPPTPRVPAADGEIEMKLPIEERLNSRVAKMHELHQQLHEKHEEAMRMQAHHTGILQDIMQQVKTFTSMNKMVRFNSSLSKARAGVEDPDEKQMKELLGKPEESRPQGDVAAVPSQEHKEFADSSSSASPDSTSPEVGKSPSAASTAGYLLGSLGSRGNIVAGTGETRPALSERHATKKGQVGSMGIDVETLQDVQGWHVSRSKAKISTGLERFRPTVESVSSVLIIVNILYLGVETEFSMHSAQKGLPSPLWLWCVSLGFAIVFTIEIVLRIAMEKWVFFYGPHWKWNLFDTSLVLVQFVDIAFAVIDLSFIRALRCLRSLRALRVLRTVAYVRELRLMLASISASFTSLMWSFVLLLLALYLFALGLEQTIQAHIEIAGTRGLHPQLKPLYGSLGSAMVTLFMAISGGMDWSDLVEPLLEISWAYLLFFMGFITFTLFGMLNILTAVFVEATNRIAEVDQDLVIQEHLDHESSVIGKVREYLAEADTDGSGTISKDEFEAKLADPHFQAQLSILDLDSYEAQGVFRILNIHDTDEVEIEEFIYGLIRLKGNAKAVDVVTMLCESRRIVRRLVAFMKYTEDNFNELRGDLGLTSHSRKDMKTYLNQTAGALKNTVDSEA